MGETGVLVLISLGALVLAAVFWRRSVAGGPEADRAFRGETEAALRDAPAASPPETAAAGLPGDKGTVSSELDVLARRFESRLDGKIRELRELIDRAEELSLRLERRIVEQDLAGAGRDGTRRAQGRTARERIAELYQDGMKVEAIASRLGLPRGEVELILSLERNQS